ncbi:glucoamylase [Purpureocillium lavendulum]|uniref:Glucoamylase n=1 Tax=Purpureocillium lavendulum TaxID=1247861 RepID=A0AB34FSS2_9HYPO|nr:glucoamylase [Purpureocillium lavendulum]
MQWSALTALALAALVHTAPTAVAAPVEGPAPAPAPAPNSAPRHGLPVVHTTTTSTGQVIDWVKPESQAGGKIAKPPASPPPRSKARAKAKRAGTGPGRGAITPTLEQLLHDPAVKGPDGTVPILRSTAGGGPTTLPPKRLPRAEDHAVANASDPLQQQHEQRSYAGTHWYASSNQFVTSRGGMATFSLFGPYTQRRSDFSLLQTAVVRGGAAHAGTGPVDQTVEAGWIAYPDQASPPHLFAYYTTNGYAADGDGIGGWNRDHAGWVQTDASVYPGVGFSPLSVDGGTQYEMEICYQLDGGNWWLWVLDRWIGYYPGALFAAGGVAVDDTLGGHSDRIHFYGEIYNSGDDMTTTDMGSGQFAESGWYHSAYQHNIVYYDLNNNAVDYDAGGNFVISDSGRYSLVSHFKSGNEWGSYMYLGGPGAGGVIGG